MLKRIGTEQLRIGMFVARLGGPWLNHPFWRSRFLITEEDQIRQIVDARVGEVWIDILKGRNVAMPEAPQPPAPVSAEARQPVPLETELVLAREILANGRSVVGSMFSAARMGKALDMGGALLLVDSASSSLSRHAQALIALARLKTRQDYTYLHAFAVCALMIATGRMLGLPDAEVHQLGLGGLVHDIGKVAIPDAVLNKAAAMTTAEAEAMRRHPSAGYRILNEARLYTHIPLDVCMHHHERIDGRGYPFGLVGHEISLHAKIAAVCDTYDSLTSNHPGHQAWSPARAMEYIAVRVDTLFDRTVFQAFSRSVGIYPLGTVLRLRSNRLAVVCEQNPDAPLQPGAIAFHSIADAAPIVPVRVDLDEENDGVVAFENARDWGYSDEQLLALCADPSSAAAGALSCDPGEAAAQG